MRRGEVCRGAEVVLDFQAQGRGEAEQNRRLRQRRQSKFQPLEPWRGVLAALLEKREPRPVRADAALGRLHQGEGGVSAEAAGLADEPQADGNRLARRKKARARGFRRVQHVGRHPRRRKAVGRGGGIGRRVENLRKRADAEQRATRTGAQPHAADEPFQRRAERAPPGGAGETLEASGIRAREDKACLKERGKTDARAGLTLRWLATCLHTDLNGCGWPIEPRAKREDFARELTGGLYRPTRLRRFAVFGALCGALRALKPAFRFCRALGARNNAARGMRTLPQFIAAPRHACDRGDERDPRNPA